MELITRRKIGITRDANLLQRVEWFGIKIFQRFLSNFIGLTYRINASQQKIQMKRGQIMIIDLFRTHFFREIFAGVFRFCESGRHDANNRLFEES